jgi:hypothetical protein
MHMRFSHEQAGPFRRREHGVALRISVRVPVLLTCWAVQPAFSVSVIWIVAALCGALDLVVQLSLRGVGQLTAGSPASFPRAGRENFPA